VRFPISLANRSARSAICACLIPAQAAHFLGLLHRAPGAHLRGALSPIGFSVIFLANPCRCWFPVFFFRVIHRGNGALAYESCLHRHRLKRFAGSTFICIAFCRRRAASFSPRFAVTMSRYLFFSFCDKGANQRASVLCRCSSVYVISAFVAQYAHLHLVGIFSLSFWLLIRPAMFCGVFLVFHGAFFVPLMFCLICATGMFFVFLRHRPAPECRLLVRRPWAPVLPVLGAAVGARCRSAAAWLGALGRRCLGVWAPPSVPGAEAPPFGSAPLGAGAAGSGRRRRCPVPECRRLVRRPWAPVPRRLGAAVCTRCRSAAAWFGALGRRCRRFWAPPSAPGA